MHGTSSAMGVSTNSDSPMSYDKLMLGCEERKLKEGHLLPNSFLTRSQKGYSTSLNIFPPK